MDKSEILEGLKKAILEYNPEYGEEMAKKAVEAGIDPLEAIDKLTEAIRQVGELFQSGEAFLPELVMAAEVMQRALPPLEEKIKSQGKSRKQLGYLVIGTVRGDIHEIGKNIVATLFRVENWEVIDLGVDVSVEKFVEAVKDKVKEKKPCLLGMSCLITPSIREATKVVETLKSEGLRDKVVVMMGGGAITKEIANQAGVDIYSPTAQGAVEEVRKIFG
ncbi:MAG: hypothetical protein DRO36_04390 [Candidatus Hecatellales archaeon]|nr:MAG: hypothetical protein DRO36_04390 [Candidatus Hecatellales archaeon]